MLEGDHSRLAELNVQLDAFLVKNPRLRIGSAHSGGGGLHVNWHPLQAAPAGPACQRSRFRGQLAGMSEVATTQRDSGEHDQRVDLTGKVALVAGLRQQPEGKRLSQAGRTRPERADRILVGRHVPLSA